MTNNIAELFAIIPVVEQVNVYYNWQLIHVDPDDNKFVDLAIAANADFLVTNDTHFNVLKTVDFPEVKILSADEFVVELKSLKSM